MRKRSERGMRMREIRRILTAACFGTAAALSALVPLSTSAASAQAPPLVSGIQPYQVFPYKGFRANIPFHANVQGSLTSLVSDSGTGEVVAEGRWEIAPDAPATYELPKEKEVVRLIRTSSRDLVIANVPINSRNEYKIRFTCGDRSFEVDHVLVGEIWVIGGSVNAFGAPGRKPSEPVPFVHFLQDGAWKPGKDPLFPSDEPLPPQCEQITHWLCAAQGYYQNTGIPVGLMGWAAPVLSMAACWSDEGTEMPVFKSLIETHGRGASAFFWQQGEGDAHPQGIAAYGAHLKSIASSVRRYADNPDMLIVVLQLSSYQDTRGLPPTPYFGRVRDAQRLFCMQDLKSILVPTMHHALRDAFRLSEDGVRSLGGQLGEAMTEAKEKKRAVWQGPRPVSAVFGDPARRQIVVRFENTEGILVERKSEKDWTVTDARHLGYEEAFVEEIRDDVATVRLKGARSGQVLSGPKEETVRFKLEDGGFIEVMRVSAHGKQSVRLELAAPAAAGARVSYGLWDNAAGSVRDERGKRAAAFADLAVEEPR